MSALLVLVVVGIAVSSIGDGIRGTRRMLSSVLRNLVQNQTSGWNQRRMNDGRSNMRAGGIICIAIGALMAVVTVISRNEAVATIAAILLGIGLPMLTVSICRGLGIQQPPLYTWVIVAGIVVSPFGLINWGGALISGEIIGAGMLLLWFDRKDKIMDTFGDGNPNTAEIRYSRLRRTFITIIGLACVVALTAFSVKYVWIWLIVAGIAAAYFMHRKLQKMKQAKAEEEAARAAEVERILNTKVEGLDYEDDELLRKYMDDSAPPPRQAAIPVELRKGERRTVSGSDMEVRLTGATHDSDLDCYVFLLDGHSKVHSDSDLIFFGQKSSPDRSVKIVDGEAGPGADITLSRVPQNVDRIAVAFAPGYNATPGATWKGGTVTVQAGDSIFTYPIAADGKTRTVSALRLYRRDGEWKLWVTDHRSVHGISTLCEEYGVNVA